MTDVYLEIGTKKVFASAADWPGWARSGKGDEGALDALEAYRSRYAAVAEAAGLQLPPATEAFVIAERLPGDTTTDFGAPSQPAAAESAPLSAAEADRLATLVEAAWTVLDRIVAQTPEELRKGPRGGGRDRDKMVGHVLGAEQAYARKIGVRQRQPAFDDASAIAELRSAIATAIRSVSSKAGGVTVEDKGWPARYAARRIAWHALDHAWEMQDRTES